MVNLQFADVTGGYERFDALRKNLEGIFEQVKAMKKYKLDISYYENKFEEFKKEFKLQDDFLQSSQMPFAEMQTEYEKLVLTECNKKLEALTNEFEENVTPLYNIYILFRTIDEMMESQNDDIDTIISNTKKLIDQINGISTHNKIDITRLIERAYETIYKVLKYEEIYGKHDVLEFLQTKNLSTNRENLGTVIRKDMRKQLESGSLSKKEITQEFIDHIEEGLGYDYLSPDFLNQMSKKSLSSEHKVVYARKVEATDDYEREVSDFQRRKQAEIERYVESKNDVHNFKMQKASLKGKMFALMMVPILAAGAGRLTGKLISNGITEYSTTTRVVDLVNQKVVGEPKMVYDEHATTYVATITIYEPWRKNPAGYGYIRNATAYEYMVPDNVGEDYHVSIDDIQGKLREKYKFNEPKDVLTEEDSMTDNVVYVTETYQDKTDTRKSTKYVVPGTVIGGVFGIGLLILLCMLRDISLSEISYEINKAKRNMETGKGDMEKFKARIQKLQAEAERIKEEKKQIEEKYGIQLQENDLDIPELKTLKR